MEKLNLPSGPYKHLFNVLFYLIYLIILNNLNINNNENNLF